jgi:hypothetical protein
MSSCLQEKTPGQTRKKAINRPSFFSAKGGSTRRSSVCGFAGEADFAAEAGFRRRKRPQSFSLTAFPARWREDGWTDERMDGRRTALWLREIIY